MQGSIVSGLLDLLPAHGVVRKHKDREAWLEARKGRMTGSKAAALFGVSRYLTEYKLWALESGLMEEEIEDNGNLRRGRRLERPVLEELAEARGWDVEPWPQTWTLDYPDDPMSVGARLSCTPDAVARVRNPLDWEPFEGGEIINAQVKTVNEWAFKQWERDADGSVVMPIEYQIQTQIETACLGLNHGVLVLQPSMNLDDMIVLPYAINHAFLTKLMKLAAAFWQKVIDGIEPDADGSETTWDTLKKVYAEENGTAIILPEEADEIADEFEEAKLVVKEGKARVLAAKNKLIAMIGERTFAQTPMGQTYSYKGRSSTRIDSKALRAAYPSIAKECEAKSEFRVLLPCKSIPQALLQEALAGKELGEVSSGEDE